jgi:two-component SAPR family response regulator
MIDALWPDTSGDAGEKAFDTNLYRLRKLLTIPEAIILTGKKLTLNPKFCWIDTWAFEHLATQADKSMSDGIVPTENAINLYQGHFLMHEDESTQVLLFREKLRQRFISMILKAGKDSEQKQSWDKAIKYYQKGLEAYGLAEELYQQLMHSYHETGQPAEVVKTYKRCCLALSTGLGINPSMKTNEIYQRTIQ